MEEDILLLEEMKNNSIKLSKQTSTQDICNIIFKSEE